MKRRTFVAGVTATGMALINGTAGLTQEDAGTATPTGGEMMTQAAVQSGYAPVNGLQLYYEIHGEGAGVPLVVLHGAYQTGTAPGLAGMGEFVGPLAASRRVIAPDLQAHGRTADIDRPLRFEPMADDVAALLDHLGIERADLFGFSLGGAVAVQLALRHPGRVRKLVAASVASRSSEDAVYPELYAGMEQITPEVFHGTPFYEEYVRVAPDPDAFPALVEKKKDLDAQGHAWPDAELRAIAAPTMIVAGDADIVRPGHAVALFTLRGGGVPGDLAGLPPARLAILPGTTHLGMLSRASWLVPMIVEFLDAPMPEDESL